MHTKMWQAIALGTGASLFFAFTFVLNRQMNLEGGSWLWSSSLRFWFMAPMLFILVAARGQLPPLIVAMRKRPLAWLGWSSIGFGVFYSGVCLGSIFGSSWLTAATWQITIVMGALLSPLFHQESTGVEPQKRHRIPVRALGFSLIILAGIALVQISQAHDTTSNSLWSILCILIAATAYPLGNRKMMQVSVGEQLNTTQRVLGMTLASLPFWLIISIAGLVTTGVPSGGQIIQSGLVAVFSGVIATLMFFKATELVQYDLHRLAVVESTQAGEVVFATIGGVLIFQDQIPTIIGFAGLAIVVIGMIVSSILSREKT